MTEATYERIYVRRKFPVREKVDGKRRTEHPEYRIWTGMIARCSNPKANAYHRYGGRGIDVCARWREDFANFYADMGPRPSLKHSIDRIDNDGNYEPGNCRWATPREQILNRSSGVSSMAWSDRDIAVLRRMYEAHYSVEEIAVALNRTEATVKLRLFTNGMRRSSSFTRLVNRNIELRPVLVEKGRDAFVEAVAEKKKSQIQRQGAEKYRKAQEKAAKTAEILSQDVDRNEKIKLLRQAGLNLSEIGGLFGITRERIRQLEAKGYPTGGHAVGAERKISSTNPEVRRQKISRLCRAWNAASREAKLLFLKAASDSVFTKLSTDMVEAQGDEQ